MTDSLEGDMASFDGIIIGGGHNGLTCAAYLARTGLRVAVVEANEKIGGGSITEEVTLPGFKHNLHSNFHLFTDGPIGADLELHRYGLEYVYPEVQDGMAFRDGTAVCIYRDPERTAQSFARLSKGDADRWRELHENFAVRARRFVLQTLYSLPLSPPDLAQRVTGPLGQDMVSYGQLSLYEAVDKNFEDERIRCLFKTFLHSITLMNLPNLGSFFPRLVSCLVTFGLPKGGAEALPRALGRVIEEAGGTLVTGQRVEEILVEGGRARGIRVAGGDVLRADRFVASGVDVVQTVQMAGQEHFGREVSERVEHLQWSKHSLVTIHVALNDPPQYRAAEFDPDINRAYNIAFGVADSDELAQLFHGFIEQGRLPERFHGNGACNTLFDPSYAPPGKHTAFWWPFAPYRLEGNPENWDQRRGEVTRELLSQWREFAPNMTEDNVLGTYLFTPVDIERSCINMREGSHHGIAYLPTQLGVNRPVPELSGYRTPVEGLYLCGFTSHSGGAITGSPGYNCANVISDDLDVPRWWTAVPEPSWAE
jgi:phytoene dehydrogenase-like protein